MNTLSLGHAILATLAYADLFDIPLTAEEVWRNLFFPARGDISFFDVIDELERNADIRGRVDSGKGFYFLKGKHANVDIRLLRYTIAERKYRRARRVARVLAAMPFVRMICVCNTLGWSNARDESDIDFFIVAERGHLWTARMFCTGLMQLYGARPHKDRMRDAICLSFFAADNALDLSPLFLEEHDGMPDVYFLYWIPYCVPLYDSGGVHHRFWNANKDTVLSVLSCATFYDTNIRRRVRILGLCVFLKTCAERCVEFFGDTIECMARKFQMRILPKDLKDMVNTDTRVVMNDQVLKFHQEDRREEIRVKFIQRLKELGVIQKE